MGIWTPRETTGVIPDISKLFEAPGDAGPSQYRPEGFCDPSDKRSTFETLGTT